MARIDRSRRTHASRGRVVIVAAGVFRVGACTVACEGRLDTVDDATGAIPPTIRGRSRVRQSSILVFQSAFSCLQISPTICSTSTRGLSTTLGARVSAVLSLARARCSQSPRTSISSDVLVACVDLHGLSMPADTGTSTERRGMQRTPGAAASVGACRVLRCNCVLSACPSPCVRLCLSFCAYTSSVCHPVSPVNSRLKTRPGTATHTQAQCRLAIPSSVASGFVVAVSPALSLTWQVPPGTKPVDDDDRSIDYTPASHWTTVRGQQYVGRSAHVASDVGDRLRYAFRGPVIDIYGSRAPSYGLARVVLDGKAVDAIDAFAAKSEDGILLFSASNLADSSHVLELVVLDPPNGRSPRVLIDAIVVRGKTGAAEQPRRMERRGVKPAARARKVVKKPTPQTRPPRKSTSKSARGPAQKPTGQRIAKSRKPSLKSRPRKTGSGSSFEPSKSPARKPSGKAWRLSQHGKTGVAGMQLAVVDDSHAIIIDKVRNIRRSLTDHRRSSITRSRHKVIRPGRRCTISTTTRSARSTRSPTRSAPAGPGCPTAP